MYASTIYYIKFSYNFFDNFEWSEIFNRFGNAGLGVMMRIIQILLKRGHVSQEDILKIRNFLYKEKPDELISLLEACISNGILYKDNEGLIACQMIDEAKQKQNKYNADAAERMQRKRERDRGSYLQKEESKALQPEEATKKQDHVHIQVTRNSNSVTRNATAMNGFQNQNQRPTDNQQQPHEDFLRQELDKM